MTRDLIAVEGEQVRLKNAKHNGSISQATFQKEFDDSIKRMHELGEMIKNDQDLLDALTKRKQLTPQQKQLLEHYKKLFGKL